MPRLLWTYSTYLLLLMTGCGGATPTAPAPSVTPIFTPGHVYRLNVITDGGEPGCVPSPTTGVPAFSAPVSLQKEAEDWVVRSLQPVDGDLTVRWREEPTSGGLMTVTGAAGGALIASVGPDARWALALELTDVAVSGAGGAGSGIAFGTMSGALTMTETGRPPRRCTSARWTMGPTPGPATGG